MNLTDKQSLRLLLKERGLRPQKRFGQNFLVDKSLPRKLVEAAGVSAEDTVLEIGPGIGAITQALAQEAKRVIAVEKDREMVNILQSTLAGLENVKVVQADVLRIPFADLLLPASYQVVGNLPFYLTAPVIRRFLEEERKPRLMALVVQKEVAQRICAKPPRMSILANAVQFYADPEIISIISKKSFFPEPKVDAALIKITPRPAPMGDDSKMFFEIVRAGFAHPRKQLLNNLSQGLGRSREEILPWLQKNNIEPQQRAETLSVDDWLNLLKNYRIQ